MPGLSNEKIAQFESRLRCRLPEHMRELLSYSAGFSVSSLGTVRFTGDNDFEFSNAFPRSRALLADGCGNFWVTDIDPTTGEWGAVFFVSHDPPVLVIQAPELGQFLLQVLDPSESKPQRALTNFREKAVQRIWTNDPWLSSVLDARNSQDNDVATFAAQLPPNFSLADLRSKEIGSGFSWGRAGAAATIQRDNSKLLFGVEQSRPGLIRRDLSRAR